MAPGRMQVATVPVGYGDGYPRNLSGKGYVLIHGKKAPVLGRICMDQFMVDVTGIPDVGPDTPVTLAGRDGEETVTIEDWIIELGGPGRRFPLRACLQPGQAGAPGIHTERTGHGNQGLSEGHLAQVGRGAVSFPGRRENTLC